MLHGPSVGVHNLGQRGSRVHMACRIKFYAITGSSRGLDESELMSGGMGGVGELGKHYRVGEKVSFISSFCASAKKEGKK